MFELSGHQADAILALRLSRLTGLERQKILDELEHAFKFNDAVLRHLIVRMKKAETGASPMMKEEKSRDMLESAKPESDKAEAPAEQPAAA